MVAVSKHLCGVATDLTLRCLHHAASKPIVNPAPPPSDHGGGGGAGAGSGAGGAQPPDPAADDAIVTPVPLVHGVAVALCCHHCCSWDDYVGKEWCVPVLAAPLSAPALARHTRTPDMLTPWLTQQADANFGVGGGGRL
eukprot:COSAG01_NODE_5174_length_4433_cov_2.338486_3_plen_139_part_00